VLALGHADSEARQRFGDLDLTGEPRVFAPLAAVLEQLAFRFRRLAGQVAPLGADVDPTRGARASGAPTQAWMPRPNAECSRAFLRSMSSSFGRSNEAPRWLTPIRVATPARERRRDWLRAASAIVGCVTRAGRE
jgi:hypothetical protein